MPKNSEETNVEQAAKLLAQNKLVAIPTETVYGLAANALSEEAVLKIFEAKKRPHFDPLIVHIPNISEMEKYARDVPPLARTLAEEYWPGPLTLILPKQPVIPDLVTSGLPFVGIRVPKHPLTLHLLDNLDFPLAAPSANPFKYVSPTSAQHVADQLGRQVDFILDGGLCTVGIESTILSFTENKPKILRLGGISQIEIERITGKIEVQTSSSNPMAPGQLDKHYATLKKMTLVEKLPFEALANCVYIAFGTQTVKYTPHLNLSISADLQEAAKNLFSVLRLADKMKGNQIVMQKVPNEGIGKAINDRLQRAAY